MRVEFYGLKFDLPPGWADITHDLPSGSPPSLASQTGVGAIQFSIAKYRGGEVPGITISALRYLIKRFCDEHSLKCDNIVEFSGNILSVEIRQNVSERFLIARYFTNGNDIGFATYNSLAINRDEMRDELIDVDRIFESIDF